MYEYIPEIMTFKECQKILKVGKNTLLDLIHTNQLEAFKVIVSDIDKAVKRALWIQILKCR